MRKITVNKMANSKETKGKSKVESTGGSKERKTKGKEQREANGDDKREYIGEINEKQSKTKSPKQNNKNQAKTKTGDRRERRRRRHKNISVVRKANRSPAKKQATGKANIKKTQLDPKSKLIKMASAISTESGQMRWMRTPQVHIT
jgi:hypothetical protein